MDESTRSHEKGTPGEVRRRRGFGREGFERDGPNGFASRSTMMRNNQDPTYLREATVDSKRVIALRKAFEDSIALTSHVNVSDRPTAHRFNS